MFDFLKPNKDQSKLIAEIKSLKRKEDYLYAIQKNSLTILADLEFESLTQRVVDNIVEVFDYSSSVLFLKPENENYIYSHTFSNTFVVKKVVNQFGRSFRDHKASLESDKSLVVRTANEHKSFEGDNLPEFISPTLSRPLAYLTQTILAIKRTITFPIDIEGVTVGVIMFNSKRASFEEDEKEMLKIFVDQIKIALYNSRLYQEVTKQVKELKEKNRDLSYLFNLTAQISKSLDPEEVAQTAVNSLPQDELMIGAILSTYDKDKGEIYVHSVTENTFAYQVGKVIGDFKQYKLLLNDESHKDNLILKAVLLDTIQNSEHLSGILSPLMNNSIINVLEKILQIRSVVVHPVRARGEVIGTISYLLKSKNYHELVENEQKLLETFTNQISIALENANLFTQQKKTQNELEQTLIELNERRRFEQDMIDVMGHELRTPMSIVRNALSLMEMEFKTKGQISLEHQKKYVNMGLEASRREINLIETLLSSAKSDGKGFQLVLDKVDLVQIVDNSILGLEKEAEKKSLTINFLKNIPELFVYADPTRIQEISDNFLSNAIKYTEKGSIEIKIISKNNLGYISYKDTGYGIAEEDIKQLGQKFFRAKQYTDQGKDEINIIRPGGTGLGLFVSFSLIKVMEGDLKIESKVGVGSTFTFGIPLYSNQQRIQVTRNAEDYELTN